MSDDFLNDLFDLGSNDDLKDQTRSRRFQKAPFGWVGGKAKSLEHLMPEILDRLQGKWVDVFGGSGIVSLNVPDVKLMVFNDAYSAIVDFYRVLQSEKFDDLKSYMSECMHPLSREEWIRCRATWCDEHDPVKRAAKWLYMIKNSVIGKGQSFGRATNSSPPIKIPQSLELFQSFHWKLRNFQLENLDFRTCIRDYDSHDAVIYCDPPYVGTDPGIYEHKFKESDLRDLLRLIEHGHGCYLLSGYDSPLIDSMDFWDHRYSWKVRLHSEAQAYTEENYKSDKENVQIVGLAEEVLWIKEAS